MLKRLPQGEKGFTLVELLASLVILSMVIGLTSQIFNTGLRITNKTAAQLDLRRISRSIVTTMEKDIQASYEAQVPPPDTLGNKTLNLLQYNGSSLYIVKSYNFNPTLQTISVSTNGGTPVTIATNVTAASFGDIIGQTKTRILYNVPLSITLGEQTATLNTTTDAAPRWNSGPGTPYIRSVDPGALSVTSSDLNLTGVAPSVYVIPTTDYPTRTTLAITGVNTNWNGSSVVTLQSEGTVMATSDVASVTSVYGSGISNHLAVTTSGSTQVLQVTLYTMDGKSLPFGYYDLHVVTNNVDVWAPSIFSSQWDSSDWSTAQGQSNGIWSADFPYVTKLNKNDSGKPDYFVAKQESNPNVQIEINTDSSQLSQYSYGNTSPAVPDAEIALWAENTGGAKDNSYIGVGVNNKNLIIRQVTSTNNNNNTTFTATVLQQIPLSYFGSDFSFSSGSIVLGINAANANGVGTINVIMNGHTYTTNVTPTDGTYIGMVVPNTNLTSVSFSVMRL